MSEMQQITKTISEKPGGLFILQTDERDNLRLRVIIPTRFVVLYYYLLYPYFSSLLGNGYRLKLLSGGLTGLRNPVHVEN